MKKLILCLLISLILFLFYKCDKENPVEPPKQFITYGLYVNKSTINGNLDVLQIKIEYILDSLGINNTPSTFEKPQSSYYEALLDVQQIEKFKNIINQAKEIYNIEKFKNDSVLIGIINNYYGLTKNGINPENIIYLDSITLTLPYVLNTRWEDEENPQNYFEILDENDCKISFKGKQYQANYVHRGLTLYFAPFSPITTIRFLTGNTAKFIDPKDNEIYIFVRKHL